MTKKIDLHFLSFLKITQTLFTFQVFLNKFIERTKKKKTV